MARLARAEIFDPSEIVAVHLIGKTVRSCYLMGIDERSGKNFDHRKRWLEEKLKLLAANFGIDLSAFSCFANHFHLLLRSRSDVVATPFSSHQCNCPEYGFDWGFVTLLLHWDHI